MRTEYYGCVHDGGSEGNEGYKSRREQKEEGGGMKNEHKGNVSAFMLERNLAMVIMCDPVYNSQLAKQISKRARRQRNTEAVDYYVLMVNTMIELAIVEKQKAKSGFIAEALRLRIVQLDYANDEFEIRRYDKCKMNVNLNSNF